MNRELGFCSIRRLQLPPREFQTISQHLHAGSRTGHDATQQAESRPVMDALLALRAGLRGHDFPREVQHLIKEHGVGRPSSWKSPRPRAWRKGIFAIHFKTSPRRR